MKIKLPVTWEVCGLVEVEANSIEEAVEYFNQNSSDIELPENPEYVEGSFVLSDDDPDCIKCFQKS